MSYYPTLDEDLKRAKEILERGKAPGIAGIGVTIAPEVAQLIDAAGGGTIYGGDTYAAYKLLESFVAEIERLGVEHTRAVLHYTAKGYAAGENADATHWRERAEKAEAEHAQYVATHFRPDHNGECLNCDEPEDGHGLAERLAQTEEQLRQVLVGKVELREEVTQLMADAERERTARRVVDEALRQAHAEVEQLRAQLTVELLLVGQFVDLLAEIERLREQVATLERESDDAGNGWGKCVEANAALMADAERERTARRVVDEALRQARAAITVDEQTITHNIATIEAQNATIRQLRAEIEQQRGHLVSTMQRNVLLLAELAQFYGLFSDYNEPCENYLHAQGIWHERNRRDEIERIEVRQLRVLLREFLDNHAANADAEGMSAICECRLCRQTRTHLSGHS